MEFKEFKKFNYINASKKFCIVEPLIVATLGDRA